MVGRGRRLVLHTYRSITTAMMVTVLAPLLFLAGGAQPRMHTVALDQFPYSVVVDAATNRVFVATAGDSGLQYGTPAHNSFGAGGLPADHIVVCDLATGALLRTITIGMGTLRMAVDGQTGHVFVVDDTGMLAMLDGDSGEPIRTATVASPPVGLVVDERLKRLFLAAENGTLSSFDTRTGRLLATSQIPAFSSALSLDQGTDHLFVVGSLPSAGGAITTIDAASGRLLNLVRVGLFPITPVVDRRTRRAFVVNQNGHSISVLDSASGRVLSTVPGGQQPDSVVVDEARGRAFVLDGAGASVLVLDAGTGRVLREMADSHDPVALALSTRYGRLFAVNADGTVSVLDARTGAVLRTVALLPAALHWVPDAVTMDQRGDRLFVAGDRDGGAAAFVLNGRDGSILRALPVGMGPHTIVTDERTGRVIITAGPLAGQGAGAAPGGWMARLGRLLHTLGPAPSVDASVAGSVNILDGAG